MTNLLVALANIVENPNTDVLAESTSLNRVNAEGDALEYYVLDAFCNSLHLEKGTEKDKIQNQYFSYLGNASNPPDIMIKNGDAIEVKKIKSLTSQIALNSSYPKDKLFADSKMIKEDCRICEDWKEKDMLYVIGVVPNIKLKVLWFVYGDCYAAKRGIYKMIKEKISEGVNTIQGVEFAETKEIGRVNKVDPLGITYLRIRGMWGIENPIKVFENNVTIDSQKDFTLNALLLEEKYLSFPDKDRQRLEKLESEYFKIQDIEIKSPNNPAKLLKAKLISYAK